MTRHRHHWSLYASAIVCALVCVLLGLQAWEADHDADRSIGISIEEHEDHLGIIDLAAGGPAEQAGLEIGDTLVEIGGKRLRAIQDFDAATRHLAPGEPVSVRLDREGTIKVFNVTPGMSMNAWRWLRRAVVALVSVLVGSLSLVRRPRGIRARLLAALFALIAFEFALPEGIRSDSPWLVVQNLAFYLSTGLQLAVELHLASLIPKPRPPSHRLNDLVPIYYLVGVAIAVAGSITYLDALVGRERFPWTLHGFDELIHQVVLPAWAVWLVVLLAYSTATSRTRLGRLQATTVLLGVLPWTCYIAIGWLTDYPDRLTTYGFWYVAMPFLVLCYPVAVFLAILRYKLFDLEVVVRRSLIYTALTASSVLFFYGAVGAGGAFEEGKGIWSFAVATALLGLFFSPLRRAVRAAIDRRFFPERQAMRQRLIALASELPVQGKLDLMGRHLVLSLRRILRVRTATLMLADKPGSHLLVRVAASGPSPKDRQEPLLLGLDDALIARACSSSVPLSVPDLRAAGPSPKSKLPISDSGIAIPLSLEDRLVGLLLLDEKKTGLRFNAEELELLRLLAHNVAAVLENVRLFESATYEGLTGLMRREAIVQLLDRELERAHRYRRPLTIALADIDHFKAVNDRFGHLEGDRALQRVARELSDQIRASDALGRYGGEEFLLVFPETDLTDGSRLSEKLRQAVEKIDLATEELRAPDLRISIGVSTLSPLGSKGPTTVEDLIRAADRALYRAKELGRNRVEPVVLSRAPELSA
jgi:diguanylate cyclase (GGDEF)-like protein